MIVAYPVIFAPETVILTGDVIHQGHPGYGHIFRKMLAGLVLVCPQ